MKNNYQKTVYACFVGYIVQAIINNFVPLLFITFEKSYHIPMSQITMLITFNFGIQLFVDFLSAKFVDKIGYRISVVLAHVFSATGLICLAILPDLLPNAFTGLLIAVVIYAIGGGLIEVLISPIVESCPTDHKEKTMSLLHSFYCWGHVGVVLLSTLFFAVFGIENWKILSLLWALVPVANGVAFAFVPIATPQSAGQAGLPLGKLLRSGLFWIFFLMMLCAGASEQGVAQWASAFAEKALGIPKAVGDLAGPLSFAVMMGTVRALFAKFSDRISLDKALTICGLLCVVSYLLASLSPNPVLSFIGCALCGVSVAIMWPGTLSTGAAQIKGGGTAMFALFAVAGDVGCSVGPTLVGMVSDRLGGDLKRGILAGAIYPIGLLVAILCRRIYQKRHST